MKLLIFDSGPLISMTLNGLLHTLELLKDKFPEVKMVITPQVKREVVDKPMTIKKYELEAIKVQTLIDRGVLVMATNFVPANKLAKETQRALNLANSVARAERESLRIVQEGEASCLAFANLCECENLLVVDERVTRLLTESPQNLKALQERKLHTPIFINQKILSEFKGFKSIRSTELVYVAFKNGLYEYPKTTLSLDALLYSLKYSGTAISSKEIEEIKNLV